MMQLAQPPWFVTTAFPRESMPAHLPPRAGSDTARLPIPTGPLTMNKRTIGALLVAAASVFCALPALAQDWPTRPVHIVVPYPAGGAVDTVARLTGQRLAQRLGQPVIVDNKPGGNANIGTGAVAKAAPDGYTLLMTANALATNGSLFQALPFDPQHDFAAVGQVGYAPLVVVVTAASTAHSFKDLVNQAKAEPGKLTYASAGNGSSGHLAGEALKQAAHIDVLHVPYKGGAPALNDLLGGRISFMPINPVEVISHIKAQQLRALAVASPRRIALLPDVPTLAESGLPGFEASVWWGLVAPAGTPRSTVNRLNAELQKVLAEPELRARLEALGAVITPGSPEQFADFIRNETVRWSGVIKAANIKPD
jgi:tripartite-type tricarboxylate transporter receptor subunit TctC